MTSDDVLREWQHHCDDLGWLCHNLMLNGWTDQAYGAAYCAAHYAHCILRWREMQSGKPACPQCADRFDALTCSDYEAETPIGQALMDGAELAELGD